MKVNFKRVPGVDKTFAILELVATSKDPFGISEITRALDFNKSTVFNIIHTLTDLEILKQVPDNKFGLGIQFYLLSKASRNGSQIISTIHPYLERINQKKPIFRFFSAFHPVYTPS